MGYTGLKQTHLSKTLAMLFNRYERFTNESPRLRRFHGVKLYY